MEPVGARGMEPERDGDGVVGHARSVLRANHQGVDPRVCEQAEGQAAAGYPGELGRGL